MLSICCCIHEISSCCWNESWTLLNIKRCASIECIRTLIPAHCSCYPTVRFCCKMTHRLWQCPHAERVNFSSARADLCRCEMHFADLACFWLFLPVSVVAVQVWQFLSYVTDWSEVLVHSPQSQIFCDILTNGRVQYTAKLAGFVLCLQYHDCFAET